MNDPNPDPTPPPKAKPKQQPSLSSDVHFARGTGSGNVCHLAAKIVRVHANGTVNLKVFADGLEVHTDFLAYNVSEGESYEAIGTWSWPPFVPPK